jgi:hypothetical protein
MSSLAWTKLATIIYMLAWPPRLVRTVVSSTAASLEETRERLSPYASLQRCFMRLEHIRQLVEGISPERRRKIQAAAERGACRYLSDIELKLLRYVMFPFDLVFAQHVALSVSTTTTTGYAWFMMISHFSNVISRARSFTKSF